MIAVTHADEPVGGRVVEALRAGAAGEQVLQVAGPEVAGGDLKRLLDGCDTVVHLASATDDPLDGSRRVLEAASAAGASTLVVVSSALVYGAWPSNPVPLTDEAALRPNPGFAPAVALGEVERLVADWADDHPSARVVVLRPTAVVGPEAPAWLAPALASARTVPPGETDPPAQFLHVDDLAAAVAVAVATPALAGAANVAPEGWLPGDEVRALDGRPAVRLPERVVERVVRLAWRSGLSPTPPGLLPWATHPWVVAADKLRAAGWVPTHANAEAHVAGHKPTPWATVSAKRRQEVSLVVSGVAIAGAAAGAVALARRLRRR